jgi:cyclase
VILGLIVFGWLLGMQYGPGAADVPHHDHFTVQEVAPDVFAIIRREPFGLANHANTVFIVNDHDVVVVDTQFTLEATEEVVAALRRITPKPVRTLIDTHWHDDHTFGNQVYARAFPGVQIIAQECTKEDLATVAVENRNVQVGGGAAALDAFRNALATGRSLDGSPMDAESRAAYQSTIDIVRQYLADVPRFKLTLPSETFSDRLTLHDGSRAIELYCFGPSVTRGDCVVYLPAEKVLIAGDVVDQPLPFAHGCHVAGWLSTLEHLRALDPRVIVPGHGTVLHDTAQIGRLSAALTTVQRQAIAGVAQGLTVDAIGARLDVEDARLALAGDDALLGFYFRVYFTKPVLVSACAEAAAHK